MTELHVKYVPILRYAKGEHFFPMRVDDVLKYSSLHVKNQSKPIVPTKQVTATHLNKYAQSPEVFLRTVETGPLTGLEVMQDWSQATIEMVYRWATETASGWTEDLARQAYSWFSPKTKGATQLFWWNDLMIPLLQNTLETASSDEFPRFIFSAIAEQVRPSLYRYWIKQRFLSVSFFRHPSRAFIL